MDGRTYVVGDVHGCAAELDALLAGLPLTPADRLVFLGDYVDRGPDAAGVLDRLVRLAGDRPGTVFLRGNHEDMLLDYLGFAGRHGRVFLANGGDSTARSYGLSGAITPSRLLAVMPPPHLAFLQALTLTQRLEGWLCVHAGVRPGLPLDAQAAEDLLWIRGDFLEHPHGLAETVVFGHTPFRAVLDVPGKLGIDTGCVYGGMLTAVALPDLVFHQVQRGETHVRRHARRPT